MQGPQQRVQQSQCHAAEMAEASSQSGRGLGVRIGLQAYKVAKFSSPNPPEMPDASSRSGRVLRESVSISTQRGW